MESLIGLVASFFGGWGAIAAVGVIMAAVGLLLWRVRASGARAQIAKRERERAAAREVSDKIDDKLAGRDSTSQREELRQWGPKR